MTKKKAKEKLYTLQEVMDLNSKVFRDIGFKEMRQREEKAAEERGYNRAVKEMKDKLNKMMYL